VRAIVIYEIGVEGAMRTKRQHGARCEPVAGIKAICPARIAKPLQSLQIAGSSTTSYQRPSALYLIQTVVPVSYRFVNKD
jgi:hypothetical protein